MSERPPSRWAVGPIEPETPSRVTESGAGAESPTHQLWSRTPDPCPALTASFVWVGAHGGAGVTSLAATTGVALTRCWPDPSLGWPAQVAVVCRSNAAGFDTALRAIQEVVAGAVPDLLVVALVVVADAPKPPSRRTLARIHELAAIVPTVVEVPWITSWREDPYTPQPAVTGAATAVSVSRTRIGVAATFRSLGQDR
ncbi:MAG: DUF6668 family protein [Nocardioides sp.]